MVFTKSFDWMSSTHCEKAYNFTSTLSHKAFFCITSHSRVLLVQNQKLTTYSMFTYKFTWLDCLTNNYWYTGISESTHFQNYFSEFRKKCFSTFEWIICSSFLRVDNDGFRVWSLIDRFFTVSRNTKERVRTRTKVLLMHKSPRFSTVFEKSR